MGAEHADFSGYATKVGLKCSDGRTIMRGAFAHQDKKTVPLVWQHSHDDPKNVLGHAVLEEREDGVYAHAYFNDTPEAKHAKTLVEHGDVVSLSIYANGLKEKSKQVFHGVIRELSLVLSGANPGALIDQVRIAHSDDFIETLVDEAIIYTGLELQHDDLQTDDETVDETVEHADTASADAETEEPLGDILDSMSEKQKHAMNYVLEKALEEQAKELGDGKDTAAQHSANTESEDARSDDSNTDEGDLTHQEGTTSMTKNIFDQAAAGGGATKTLSHSDFADIMADAKKRGSFKEALNEALEHGNLKEEYLAHATNAAGQTVNYGIADIEFLFPEAKLDSAGLQIYSRRQEWVQDVLDNVKKLPFAKVRTLVADITADEARAKGYMKGNKKKEEVIKLLRRSTGPTTIYKKQKLERDDVLDIGNDIDIVAWLKVEIRLMLEEELARAILVGDGRSDLSEDRIKDPEGALSGEGIRSILHDDPFYAIPAPLAPNTSPKDMVKELVRARSKYRGSGKPTLFIDDAMLTDILLEEDKFGRPLYENEQSVADKLRVSKIVVVDVFSEYEDLVAIMVNLVDYSIGTNKGGELTSFEDFDIDFNQHKYLQETRLSGGLNKPLSAIVVKRATGTLVTPAAPSFNGATNTVTIPATAGVVWEGNGVTWAPGDHVITETTEVAAAPDEGYYFPANTTRDWTFTHTP
ncbi:MAG: HK97 family phage prohead protease [Saprospiraceae bacterium]|nr:HK97 family phage prohead protease [Candidatus Brachybacter algidus]MBK8748767.1 HK97 family phage prohead protease [Candidatus Brachybacter algidus]